VNTHKTKVLQFCIRHYQLEARELRRIIKPVQGSLLMSFSGLVKKSEGKRPLGKPRRRWEDTRMNLGEIVWEGVD